MISLFSSVAGVCFNAGLIGEGPRFDGGQEVLVALPFLTLQLEKREVPNAMRSTWNIERFSFGSKFCGRLVSSLSFRDVA